VRRASVDEPPHSSGPELNRGKSHQCSAQRAETGVLARLSSAVGSFAALAYVCTATGSIGTSLAVYILSVVAAALSLRAMRWHVAPALPWAAANARVWFGSRVRHGAPGTAQTREGHAE
jgi:hypothetical protein